MYRTVLSPITRAAVARNARNVSNSLRVVRPVAIAAPRMMTVRFASSEAKNSESNETPAEETKETPASESAESETPLSPEAQEINELKEKLDAKDKELANMKNHYARAIADFRNLQDTTKKEIQKAKDFALQKFAKDLLESLDNFSLALESVKEETLKTNDDVKSLYEGVNMTRNVFEKTLSKHGIEKIDPIGQPFDPNQHEATFQVPQPDKEPGTVFHVQQHGYTLNSRVLRPAKVGLVKGEDN
ncbi:GrpE protein-like protein, mitochondrial [Scheffersomyces xylosifermentans]|uniref:GrpE protein-like protein, mitochondrial n=1 Tax=Scheffersomyces xylosifermentans TaxID=1304137 RepID=UPI00315CBA1D